MCRRSDLSQRRAPRPGSVAVCGLLCLAASLGGLSTGCASWKHGSHWGAGGKASAAGLPRDNVLTSLSSKVHHDPSTSRTLQEARRRFDRGETQAHQRSAACVDDFYAASMLAWAAYVQSGDAADRERQAHSPALRLYQDSVGRLVTEGRRYGRLNPRTGLVVREGGAARVLPIELHGFDWSPEDFHAWEVVGDYDHRSIVQPKRSKGVGAPIVVLRRKPKRTPHESDFLPEETAFSATAVVHPDGSGLAFYDPFRTSTVEMAGQPLPLARDLTAALAYGLHYHEESRLEGFLRPNKPQEPSRLIFQSPYRPDKIPVVFVHGLLSSPDTWANVLNELNATASLHETYQFWTFRYSTGAPFVRAAADLRSQLDQVRQRYDPEHDDQAFDQIVLVGHSMGGLVSRLLVSYSGEDLWNTVARVPLESLSTDERTRAALTDRMYFDPYPSVKRAVFIATPHQGSALAGRAIGRVASSLVVQNEPSYERLKRDNPGAFKGTVERRQPTSIDLLDPDQPFLQTIDRLRVNECVALHSIIGEGSLPLGIGASDGIVAVESARRLKTQSELYVEATHSSILRHAKTIAELKRILRVHAAESEASGAATETGPEAIAPGGKPAVPSANLNGWRRVGTR